MVKIDHNITQQSFLVKVQQKSFLMGRAKVFTWNLWSSMVFS